MSDQATFSGLYLVTHQNIAPQRTARVSKNDHRKLASHYNEIQLQLSDSNRNKTKRINCKRLTMTAGIVRRLFPVLL